MLTDGVIAVRHRRANLVAAFLDQADDGLLIAETTVYPFLDLAIRLWLAQLSPRWPMRRMWSSSARASAD